MIPVIDIITLGICLAFFIKFACHVNIGEILKVTPNILVSCLCKLIVYVIECDVRLYWKVSDVTSKKG